MTRSLPHVTVGRSRLPAALLALAIATTAAALPQDAAIRGSQGRIVEGSERIMSFRPAESDLIGVDAHRLDFRGVFEQLGEDATLWYQHVQTLANPFFEGRVPESEGSLRTVEYVEWYFDLYGLEPAFPEGGREWRSYRQAFEFPTRTGRVTPTIDQADMLIGDAALTDGEDFVVLGTSGSGEVSAPLSFVGYAIEEGEDGYTSFDLDSDLTGRIAVVLRYEPLDEDGRSIWNPRRFSGHASILTKMNALIGRGAAGIILVTPPDVAEGREGLESLEYTARFGPTLSVPAVQVTPGVAERLLRSGTGADDDLMTWRRRADQGEVTTVELDDKLVVGIRTQVDRPDNTRQVKAQNVGAVLRGRGALADEWIIIGAHHDHLGLGSMGGSFPANRGRLHPGADDNASGTAGVLIAARKLAKIYPALEDADLRSVMFVTFDAEEVGLQGSRYFTDHPPVEPSKMTAMINMDMIGRLRGGNVSLYGTGTGDGLIDALRPHIEASGLTVSAVPGSSNQSDDANFIRVGVPAIHFFTGLHSDYHNPGDHAYTVNPAGADRVLDLVADIAVDLAMRQEQLVAKTPDRTTGQNRGYASVRLGIRPGMNANVEAGILVEQVSEGTSAADGGMLDGDVMLSWDGEPLNSMRDLMENLRKHQPGDVVHIGVLREGKVVDLQVRLKASEG